MGPYTLCIAAVSFAAIATSCYLRNHIQHFTSIILYMNIICNAHWLYSANFEILHCSEAFSRRKTLFKQENFFKQTHVDFLPRKYDVISQSRHSYAKGPFCVARLIWKWLKDLNLPVPQKGIKVDKSAALREKILWIIKLGFWSWYLPFLIH